MASRSSSCRSPARSWAARALASCCSLLLLTSLLSSTAGSSLEATSGSKSATSAKTEFVYGSTFIGDVLNKATKPTAPGSSISYAAGDRLYHATPVPFNLFKSGPTWFSPDAFEGVRMIVNDEMGKVLDPEQAAAGVPPPQNIYTRECEVRAPLTLFLMSPTNHESRVRLEQLGMSWGWLYSIARPMGHEWVATPNDWYSRKSKLENKADWPALNFAYAFCKEMTQFDGWRNPYDQDEVMLCGERTAAELAEGGRIRARNIAALNNLPPPVGPAPDWAATTGNGVNDKVQCHAGWKCPLPALVNAFSPADEHTPAQYYLVQNQWETPSTVPNPWPYNRMHFHIFHAADMDEQQRQYGEILAGRLDPTVWNGMDAGWELLANREICTFSLTMHETIHADAAALQQTRDANDRALDHEVPAPGGSLAAQREAYGRVGRTPLSPGAREALVRKMRALAVELGSDNWAKYVTARTDLENSMLPKAEALRRIALTPQGRRIYATLQNQEAGRTLVATQRDAVPRPLGAGLAELPQVSSYLLQEFYARQVHQADWGARGNLPAPMHAAMQRRLAWKQAQAQAAEARRVEAERVRATQLRAEQQRQRQARLAQLAAPVVRAPAPQQQWREPYRSTYSGPVGAAALVAQPPVSVQPAPLNNKNVGSPHRFRQRRREKRRLEPDA